MSSSLCCFKQLPQEGAATAQDSALTHSHSSTAGSVTCHLLDLLLFVGYFLFPVNTHTHNVSNCSACEVRGNPESTLFSHSRKWQHSAIISGLLVSLLSGQYLPVICPRCPFMTGESECDILLDDFLQVILSFFALFTLCVILHFCGFCVLFSYLSFWS